jgi:hypothetical protein
VTLKRVGHLRISATLAKSTAYFQDISKAMYKLPLEKERKIEGRKNREIKIKRIKKLNNEEIKRKKQ